jgi:hypothetical protein
MTDAPLLMQWTGDGLAPATPWWAKRVDEHLVVGERYFVEVRHERSEATHRHEFAWLREAWLNLPERLADLYPTPEHLRKRALIDAGFYNEMAVDCGSNAAALRAAAAFRAIDDFAVAIVRGPIVLVRRAKSQSHRAMDRQEFQASKTALMETVAAMIGTSIDVLRRSTAA